MARENQNPDEKKVKSAVSFIFDAPCKEEIVAMDCNDYCEQLAELAEQVAKGGNLEELLPDWERHMAYWSDCREEFEALVAVLKAEYADELSDEIESIITRTPGEEAPHSP